ncbi:MAG: glycerol-3-phosphate acyltransferase [Acidimicrobiia bacterium]
MASYFLVGALAYFIGTTSFADIASRLAGDGTTNVRSDGSGNPGALNTASVHGKGWGVAVLVADLGKGVLAARLGHVIAGNLGMAIACMAVVIGHCFPLWTRFRGGKGIATTGGILIAAFPLGAPFVIATIAAAALATKSTARAALAAAAVLVAVSALWWRQGYWDAWGIRGSATLFVMSAAIALIVSSRFAVVPKTPATR